MLEINFVPRGFAKKIVLIPGWAFDYRIFNAVDWKYDYLKAVKFSPFDFAAELKDFLTGRSIEKISLLGWSMGGFLACDFASEYPEMVEELILVSVRERFGQEYLREAAEKIRENKRAWLYRFYLGCFSQLDQTGRDYFKKELLSDYLEGMELEELISGLAFLAEARIYPAALAGIKKIRFFHGESDSVAPLEEAKKISSLLPQAEFISMPGLGHNVFLNKRFEAAFNG